MLSILITVLSIRRAATFSFISNQRDTRKIMKSLVFILFIKIATSDLIFQNRLGNNRLALKSYRPVATADCFSCQIFDFLNPPRKSDSNIGAKHNIGTSAKRNIKRMLMKDLQEIIRLEQKFSTTTDNPFKHLL